MGSWTRIFKNGAVCLRRFLLPFLMKGGGGTPPAPSIVGPRTEMLLSSERSLPPSGEGGERSTFKLQRHLWVDDSEWHCHLVKDISISLSGY